MTKDPIKKQQTKPDRVTGPAHIFAAARYSFHGLLRLWAETAFRLECLGLAFVLGVYALVGAGWAACLGQGVLFLALVATEALNTAIEEIVDHLTEDWARFAAHAKDLGSLAVLCLLLANGLFSVSVLISRWDHWL